MKRPAKQRPNGPAVIVYRGMWHQAVKVVGALCGDGVRRTAIIVSEPDTYFSQPAYVRVYRNGRSYTVAGFVTSARFAVDDYETRDIHFRAYLYRKNGHLLEPEHFPEF